MASLLITDFSLLVENNHSNCLFIPTDYDQFTPKESVQIFSLLKFLKKKPIREQISNRFIYLNKNLIYLWLGSLCLILETKTP